MSNTENRVTRAWNWLRSIFDDSPGYSDHPDADIRAHRKNAKLVTWVGLVLFAISAYATVKVGEIGVLAMGLGILSLSLISSNDLRLQALEWEVQLERENND